MVYYSFKIFYNPLDFLHMEHFKLLDEFAQHTYIVINIMYEIESIHEASSHLLV